MKKINPIIVYASFHHNNTLKIAREMSEVLGAELINVLAVPKEVVIEKINNADLIGFGSGIYFWKHHKILLSISCALSFSEDKRAFIFSTAGLSFLGKFWHAPLRKVLKSKGHKIVGEFCCKGFDTVGPLILFGGLNKARPNLKDLKNAEVFIKRIILKQENIKE